MIEHILVVIYGQAYMFEHIPVLHVKSVTVQPLPGTPLCTVQLTPSPSLG